MAVEPTTRQLREQIVLLNRENRKKDDLVDLVKVEYFKKLPDIVKNCQKEYPKSLLINISIRLTRVWYSIRLKFIVIILAILWFITWRLMAIIKTIERHSKLI